MPLRKREKVQKMPRSIRCGLAALAAMGRLTAASDPLLDELGLQSSQTTDRGAYKVTALKFKDPTGAYAATLSLKGAKQLGNYVLTCEGKCPTDFSVPLASVSGTPLPILRTYLPERGQIPGSERYVVGPVGLSQASPQVTPDAAAFQFGTEAALARYHSGKNEATLAIFYYLTPQMARQQLPAFRNLAGAVAKRSGPMIGVVLNAPDEKSADALLKDIEYQASMSWDQQPPLTIRPQTAAQIVLGGFELAGFILVFCLLSGLTYGGYRVLRRKFGPINADDSLTVLGLGGK